MASGDPRQTRRVVITGLGAVTPVGNDITTMWDALVHGKSGIARIARFDPSPYASQVAGEVRGFEAGEYMDRKEIRRTDRFTHLAVGAATQAMRDAKLDKVADPERVGTAISSGLGPMRDVSRDATVEPTTIVSVIGRKASPASIGE